MKDKKTFSSMLVNGEKRYVKDELAHEKIDKIDLEIESKQDKLIAGDNITIENNVISSNLSVGDLILDCGTSTINV